MPTPGRRQERFADQLKRRISQALLQDVHDSQIGFVTVTGVDMSGDLRQARVSVSVLGDDQRVAEAMEALQRARRFLERTVFRDLGLKRPVEFRFVIDETLDRAARLEQLLQQGRPESDDEESE